MNTIKPITPQEFVQKAKVAVPLKLVNYLDYFKPQIDEAKNFAIGPYYWFIGNNSTMTITTASSNIRSLTPFDQNEWEGNSPHFFAANIHPDDCYYVLAAIQFAIEVVMNTAREKKHTIKTNIYARMLDVNREYKWRLIQTPKMYIDEDAGVTCGLILVTDISHLNFTTKPVLLTISDSSDKETQFYHFEANQIKPLPTAAPNITKRELEILHLMTKGLTTPQIATQLFISYHTVENHKRNLRKKTATKTSAQLINFIAVNNLF